MKRNNFFNTAAPASYFVYFLTAFLYLFSEALRLDKLRAALPVLSELFASDDALTVALYVYGAVAVMMLILKLVQAIFRTSFPVIPCIIADIALTLLHLRLYSGASLLAQIIIIVFIILSVLSLLANIISTSKK